LYVIQFNSIKFDALHINASMISHEPGHNLRAETHIFRWNDLIINVITSLSIINETK